MVSLNQQTILELYVPSTDRLSPIRDQAKSCIKFLLKYANLSFKIVSVDSPQYGSS